MAPGFRPGHMPVDAKVENQIHLEPFSKVLAHKLSGETRNMKTLYVGAGALGSKMALHDARSGNDTISVTDPDKLLQHNLARHALFADKIGRNKAEALIETIRGMYSNENEGKSKAFDGSLHLVPPSSIKQFDCMVDTTAGMDTLNFLSREDIGETIMVARAEIADEGKLGLFYVEGINRNPRMDDLVNLAYYRAMENNILEEWLKREATRERKNLDVGLGCNSATTVMPDDSVSFHASMFSKVLHNVSLKKRDAGLMYLTSLEISNLPVINSQASIIEPFGVFNCGNQSGWAIRMVADIPAKLIALCRKKSPVETGGVLVGMASYKTQTIHVFDIIVEPRGSNGHCTGFTRGNIGLPAEIDIIKEKTGNMIGYIGEWHSHPMDLERLSDLDLNTVGSLVAVNNKTPIPTLAVIVTNDKILPFVFP